MTQIQALQKLVALEQPVFSTRDAAAAFAVSTSQASQILNRLKSEKILCKVKESLWVLLGEADSFSIAKYLAIPNLSYVSMQSALYHHGMISQIPTVTFVATLAPPKRLETPLGTFSLHHVHPDFFFGFAEVSTRGALIATPEKALLDFYYFGASRSKLFKFLPELELPKKFSFEKCREAMKRIPSKRVRTIVMTKLEALRANEPKIVAR